MITNIEMNIPDTDWEQCGTDPTDPSARLLAGVAVNGLMMHFEAWAIVDQDGEQQAADPQLDEDLERLQNMMGTPFRTTEIMGREYAILATPYGR